MSERDLVLCEMCREPIRGASILWRRGFVATCCWGCGAELARTFTSGLVDFDAPGAAGVIRSVLFARPTWDEVTERIMDEHHHLWEALAKV